MISETNRILYNSYSIYSGWLYVYPHTPMRKQNIYACICVYFHTCVSVEIDGYVCIHIMPTIIPYLVATP